MHPRIDTVELHPDGYMFVNITDPDGNKRRMIVSSVIGYEYTTNAPTFLIAAFSPGDKGKIGVAWPEVVFNLFYAVRGFLDNRMPPSVEGAFIRIGQLFATNSVQDELLHRTNDLEAAAIADQTGSPEIEIARKCAIGTLRHCNHVPKCTYDT